MTEPGDRTDQARPDPARVVDPGRPAEPPAGTSLPRSLVALVPPLVALLVELMLSAYVRPSTWFLFFPAVFLSSWMGGLRVAVLASTLSVVAVLWFFIPPEHAFLKPPGQYLAAGVFFTTGVVFGVFHDHLRRANQRTARALVASERANDDLKKAINERRIFAALIENSSDFIGIASPDGKPVYVNPAGRRMVGLADDHPIETTTIPEYYAADQRAFASDVIVKAMIEQGHWEGETFFRHWQTQEAIPVSDTHFLIRAPDTGEVLGMGTVTRDISELTRTRDEAERARRELAQANEAIASLREQAPDGIFVADRAGRFIDVNTAGCRMLRCTRAELLGRTLLELVPADRVEQVAREDAQLLQGQAQVAEWVLRRKDETTLSVEVSANTMPDGRTQRFVRDITRRRQLEAALRASHADLVRAQSVADVGSWRLDVRRNELLWSEQEYRIFGIAPGTPMTYDAFLACVHPDDRAYVDQEWTAALRGQPYDIEHRVVVGDTIKWVRQKADLEFDANHTLVGGIGVSLHVTERKQREAEVREARERYELALRGADLGAWDWNIQTGEVIFNARWAEMRGYRLDEIRGHVDTWASGVHPEDWARVQQALDDHFQGRRPEYEAEHRVRTKSGQWMWILDRGKVFTLDERGAPLRMAGTELDITARKRAEEELRLAEAQATGIVSISADAIISIDEAQRITLFNEGAEKIFGYSKAEALGAPLELLVPERFRAQHRHDVARFAAGREVARPMGHPGGEVLGLRKNGQEFPADAAISKLEVGGRTVLTVALRDVTAQKRLAREQRLLAEIGAVFGASLEYEETLSNIAEVAAREIADCCLLDVIEDGEERRLRVVCRDPARAWICDALAGRSLERAHPPLVREALETRRPVLMEQLSPEQVRALAHDEAQLRAIQALHPTSAMVVPLLAHGTLLGALALVSSTETRVYGASDLQLAEQLALRAALAIENARLYRLARRASELRDEVLGVVAHDLRNPLGTILLQASLLRRPGDEPERRSRRPADTIERAASRMDRLIRDLLDVARLEAGRLSIEQSRVPASEVVSDAVDAQLSLASSASIDVQIDLPPLLPDVWGDRDRLLQVFENLLGNALKFTRPGGRVTIGARPRDGDVLFWVSDTGAGIAEAELPHVFDRFWQAGHGRGGAGLGLAIVKGIVEAHDGRVWVESALGRGSTFFFTIPTARRPEEWRAEPASPDLGR